jgi:plasmid stabilization system protein ParE
MARRLVWLPQAADDLEDITAHLARRRCTTPTGPATARENDDHADRNLQTSRPRAHRHLA